jgi:mRNA interferase MazF
VTPLRRTQRGDIMLVTFPFSDLSTTKVRPGLIVGLANDGDLIVAFITSQNEMPRAPTSCFISEDDEEFKATGLKMASTIRLDKLVTLDRTLAPRRLGRIGPEITRRVHQSIRIVFALSD